MVKEMENYLYTRGVYTFRCTNTAFRNLFLEQKVNHHRRRLRRAETRAVSTPKLENLDSVG